MSDKYSVSAVARRLANGDVTKRSLQQQASRFRRQGRHDLADNIKAALSKEVDQYPQHTAQARRLAERAERMSAEDKLKLRVTLELHGQTDLLTDVLVAWQSFFEARGMEVSTSDLFTIWALEKAGEFEELTGESIARQ
ncbi:hypothetical protein BFS14_18690 [Serratia fonticola]|uniref:hypothetical protein n=1 Tax=Serratia fonticola TaxID=47917 RepID=UPI0008FD58B0|nr:hypothetical protein [Serratia fonticola]MBC3248755.1 hypothetical protein [Serratia fonticola]OIX93416.1 hypothetical protein BFS14_18690 [Serratia fonticola]QCR62818.1 hypothetical protein FD644_21800 [Serratia fonticola]